MRSFERHPSFAPVEPFPRRELNRAVALPDGTMDVPRPRVPFHSIHAIACIGALGAALMCASMGCASTPQRPTSDGVNVVLRRIDVANAAFDRMQIDVVVAVQNTTSLDVPVSAEAAVALLGEAPSDAPAAGGDDATEDGGAIETAAAEISGADPIDGLVHRGKGAGTASAQNTSELPVRVEVPLPAEPELLERILGWRKIQVRVDGSAQVGADTRPIRGILEIAPPHLPEVRLKDAQVASADGGAAGTGFFTIVVENKNPFDVMVDRLAWTITIKDRELAPSTASGPTEVTNDPIGAKQVGEYPAEVQIDEAAFGKALKALLKNRTVPYVVQGTMEVRGIKRPFRFDGEMKFAR